MKLVKIGDTVRYVEKRGAHHPVIGQGTVAFISVGHWMDDPRHVNAVEYPDGDSRLTLTDGMIIRGDQVE